MNDRQNHENTGKLARLGGKALVALAIAFQSLFQGNSNSVAQQAVPVVQIPPAPSPQANPLTDKRLATPQRTLDPTVRIKDISFVAGDRNNHVSGMDWCSG